MDLVKQPTQPVPKGYVAPLGWAAQLPDGSRYMFTASRVPAEYSKLSDIELAEGTANSVLGQSKPLSRERIGANGTDIRFIHPNGQPMRMRIVAQKPWVYALTVATRPDAEGDLGLEPVQHFVGSLKLK